MNDPTENTNESPAETPVQPSTEGATQAATETEVGDAASDTAAATPLLPDAPTPPNDDDVDGIEPAAETPSTEGEQAEVTPPTNLPFRPTGALPIYQCHKQVVAIEIGGIEEWRNGEHIVTPKDDGAHPFEVPGDWVERHRPEVGGFVVIYADGYMSFSPRAAFLDGYTLVGTQSQETSTQPGQGEAFGAT